MLTIRFYGLCLGFVFVIWIAYVVFFPIQSLLKKWVLLYREGLALGLLSRAGWESLFPVYRSF